MWQPIDMTVPVAVQNVVPLRRLLVGLGCLEAVYLELTHKKHMALPPYMHIDHHSFALCSARQFHCLCATNTTGVPPAQKPQIYVFSSGHYS